VTWWLGFASSLGSVLGFWGTAAIAYYGWVIGADHLLLYITVPVFFFVGQLIRAVLRQATVIRLLEAYASTARSAIFADVLGFGFWSVLQLVLILTSAFGRTIRWRGIRYRLVSPTQTDVLAD
jgi:hypothetical protein